MRGRVFAVLQSMIRVVLVLALAAVPVRRGAGRRTTLHIGSVTYVVDGTRIVLLAGGLFALAAGLLAYRKMDDREQVALFDGRQDLAAQRLLGPAPAARRRRVHRLRGRRGRRQVDADRAARRRRCATAAGSCVTTHEPGATEAGQGIRNLRAAPQPAAVAAGRGAAVRRRPRAPRRHGHPAGARRRRVVLTDRFVDSSLAYQGVGRKLSIDEIRRLSRWATQGLTPDLTVLLDIARRGRAGARPRRRGAGDKLEAESLDFHERVRQAFLHAGRGRAAALPGARRDPPPDELAADVLAAVAALLSPRRVPLPPSAPSPSRSRPRSTRLHRRQAERHDRLGRADRPATTPSTRCGRRPRPRRRSCAAARAGAAGRDDARLAVHRAAGSGRSVAARAFAAALQCERHAGRLRRLRRVPHRARPRSHPDVHSVVPEGLSIPVAEMRAVVARSARRPALGRWQVVVIEDADRLTEPAANALLKAVEEPPPRTVFLLCAPSLHPDDVSLTIRSRCRLVTLRTPPAEAIAAVLQRDGVDRGAPTGPRRHRRATSAAPAGWPATPGRAQHRPAVLAIPAVAHLDGRLPGRGRPAGQRGRGRGGGAVGGARRAGVGGAAGRARRGRHRQGHGGDHPRHGRCDEGSREAAEVPLDPYAARRARPRAGRPRRVLPRRAARARALADRAAHPDFEDDVRAVAPSSGRPTCCAASTPCSSCRTRSSSTSSRASPSRR